MKEQSTNATVKQCYFNLYYSDPKQSPTYLEQNIQKDALDKWLASHT